MDPWVMAFVICMPNAVTGPDCRGFEIGPFETEQTCEASGALVRQLIEADLIANGYGAARISEHHCYQPEPPGEPV